MTKTPLRLRGLERARARIKQGTNRTRFSSIAERDVRLFIHSLCQTTEAKNLNVFFMFFKPRSHAKRNQRRQYVPLFSMKHFVGV